MKARGDVAKFGKMTEGSIKTEINTEQTLRELSFTLVLPEIYVVFVRFRSTRNHIEINY